MHIKKFILISMLRKNKKMKNKIEELYEVANPSPCEFNYYVMAPEFCAQTCYYYADNYQLSLSSLFGEVLSWNDSHANFSYLWSPCSNGVTCGYRNMATQVNTGT